MTAGTTTSLSKPGFATGDLAAAKAAAPIAVHQTLRMARHAGVSLETRGVLAHPDRRLNELLVYSSTQFPHVIRTILAESLGIAESALRVVAPDVGGGFGIKNNFNPEELAVAALALKLQRPLRWVEDRREHLLACPHAREHRYDMTAYADRTGRIAALEATVMVDAGAYSVWPWTASMEAGMSAGIMTGPTTSRSITGAPSACAPTRRRWGRIEVSAAPAPASPSRP